MLEDLIYNLEPKDEVHIIKDNSFPGSIRVDGRWEITDFKIKKLENCKHNKYPCSSYPECTYKIKLYGEKREVACLNKGLLLIKLNSSKIKIEKSVLI